MNLKVLGSFPDDLSFHISVNETEKVLDETNKKAVFDLDEPQNCKIKIHQEPSEKEYSLSGVLLFVLTFLLQGILNILLINTDSEWYLEAAPYCIKTEFEMFVSSDETLIFTYFPSQYDKKTHEYLKPKLTLEGIEQPDVEYQKNFIDLSNKYFSYAKRILSVGLTLNAFLGLILVLSMPKPVYTTPIFCGGLIVIFTVIQLVVLLKEYRRLKRIKISNR